MTLIGGVEYSDAQIANAKQIFEAFSTNYDEVMGVSAVANGDRECSLNPILRGDLDTAGGLWQWHKDRRDAILAAMGKDVWDGTVESAIEGFFWETGVTGPKEWQEALAMMRAAQTIEDVSEAWCRFYEVAGAANAVARSRSLATAWAAFFNVVEEATGA